MYVCYSVKLDNKFNIMILPHFIDFSNFFNLKNKIKNINLILVNVTYFGAVEVVIYNFWALFTIDTNIKQVIYRLPDSLIKIKKFH